MTIPETFASNVFPPQSATLTPYFPRTSSKNCRQARGQIGAVATGLHQSPSNSGSKPRLWPYTTAHCNTRSLTHWARPGIEPLTSWFLVRFINHWAMMGTPRCCISKRVFHCSFENYFYRYKILSWRCFISNTLNMLFHCLLTYICLWPECNVIIVFVPPDVMCLFWLLLRLSSYHGFWIMWLWCCLI